MMYLFLTNSTIPASAVYREAGDAIISIRFKHNERFWAKHVKFRLTLRQSSLSDYIGVYACACAYVPTRNFMTLLVLWLFVLRFLFNYRNRTQTHHVSITSLLLASVRNVLWVLAVFTTSDGW